MTLFLAEKTQLNFKHMRKRALSDCAVYLKSVGELETQDCKFPIDEVLKTELS